MASGLVTVSVFTAQHASLDGSQTPLKMLNSIRLRLHPGQKKIIRFRAQLPAGTSFLVATINDSATTPMDSNASDKVFATANEVTAA